jgi:hypothetical protein
MTDPAPKARVEGFFAKYPPKVATVGRAAVRKLQRILPGWIAMVYDNYNALVIGFSPTDRPSDAICSIALYPRWVNLFFLQGAFLDDPQGILKGSGKWVRAIRLASAADLDKPAVRALIAEARRDSPKPEKRARRDTLVIRSVSLRQRPRRPR